jgi:septal ring factor EnvC (AmiA/AmiB activator)
MRDAHVERDPAVRIHSALSVGWLALTLALAVSQPRFAFAEDSDGEQLRELRERILEVRERVGEHEREERAIFDVLFDLDQTIDRLMGQVREANREAKAARTRLAETTALETKARAQFDQTRTAMSRRVVGLYKTGEVGPLRVLFSSGSLPELLSRASFLRKVLEHDTDLVGRFRRESAALDTLHEEAKESATRRDAAAGKLESKAQLLARVRDDRAMERGVLVELERASRALEEKLVALGETSGGGGADLSPTDFQTLRGKLQQPIQGDVVSKFGLAVDAEFHTETFHKGVEFDVALGETVRAVAFGEVRYAGWFRGYGKVVILDHGAQYFTVSGHLGDIDVKVGQRVGQGVKLGASGDTGSLTGPSFYFEIRQGREPLDPVEWFE